MSNIYDNLASFGRARAWVIAIIGTVLGVFMLISGVKKYNEKTIYTGETTGTIAQSKCVEHKINKETLYRCHDIVNYTVNGQQYQVNIITDDNKPKLQGETMTIAYDPTNPQNAQQKGVSNKQVGGFTVVASLFIIGMAWLFVLLSRRYKIVAGAEGVAGFGDIIRLI